MSTQISVTNEDINSIAKKLDEFAAVLTPREQGIILSVFSIAAKVIASESAQKKAPGAPTPLSAGFRDAFKAGAGTKFSIEDDGEAEKVRNIAIDWGNAQQA